MKLMEKIRGKEQRPTEARKAAEAAAKRIIAAVKESRRPAPQQGEG